MARKGGARRVGKKVSRAARKYPPGVIPGQPAAGHKPFASKAQQRLFFANPRLRKWALGKAHATGEHHELGKASKARYAALPNRKGASYQRVPLRRGRR